MVNKKIVLSLLILSSVSLAVFVMATSTREMNIGTEYAAAINDAYGLEGTPITRSNISCRADGFCYQKVMKGHRPMAEIRVSSTWHNGSEYFNKTEAVILNESFTKLQEKFTELGAYLVARNSQGASVKIEDDGEIILT